MFEHHWHGDIGKATIFLLQGGVWQMSSVPDRLKLSVGKLSLMRHATIPIVFFSPIIMTPPVLPCFRRAHTSRDVHSMGRSPVRLGDHALGPRAPGPPPPTYRSTCRLNPNSKFNSNFESTPIPMPHPNIFPFYFPSDFPPAFLLFLIYKYIFNVVWISIYLIYVPLISYLSPISICLSYLYLSYLYISIYLSSI